MWYVHSIFKIPDVNIESSVFPEGAPPDDELDSTKRMGFDFMMLCTYGM